MKSVRDYHVDSQISKSQITNVDWLVFEAKINHVVVVVNNWKYDVKLKKKIYTAECIWQGAKEVYSNS